MAAIVADHGGGSEVLAYFTILKSRLKPGSSRSNKRDRKAFLLGLLNRGHFLACCPVNITEVYAGMRPEEHEATLSFLPP